MKILITGTHFTPAQAVIEVFKKWGNIEIIYIGRETTLEGDPTPSLESDVFKKLGVKFIPIITGRLQRALTLYTVPSLFKIPVGFLQALYVTFKEKPDVVLSFGGYVAVPVVISAYLLSIPVIIHEQTLISGLANTLTGYFATKIAVSFLKEYNFSKEKVVLTGNPIRKEVISPTYTRSPVQQFVLSAKGWPLLLITGGNQGSHIINQAIFEILNDLTNFAYVLHQSGDSVYQDFERLEKQKKQIANPQRYLVKKWLDADEMGFSLKRADLAIARAGMNFLQEAAYYGVPTLVIPIPYLYQDEQNINAKFFEKLKLVKILPQNKLTPKSLLKRLKVMIKGSESLKKGAKKSKQVVTSDAALRLALETVTLKSS